MRVKCLFKGAAATLESPELPFRLVMLDSRALIYSLTLLIMPLAYAVSLPASSSGCPKLLPSDFSVLAPALLEKGVGFA